MKNWLDFDRYAVLGLGRSGVAAANLLARHGKHVRISDTRTQDALAGQIAKLESGVEVVCEANDPGTPDVVIASPGLQPRLPIFAELKGRGVPVVSEIELAFDACDAPFVAITGTDGKTTTTSLAGALFEAAGVECAVAGNIGTPLCEVVEDLSSDGVVVAEVSAFQLWSTHHFRPVAAGFTNIAADHLDYFDTYDEYVDAKHRLMAKMSGPAGQGDCIVLNFEDPVIRAWGDGFSGRIAGYGLDRSSLDGCEIAVWSDGDGVFARLGNEDLGCWLENVRDLPLQGRHNVLNIMCAAGLGFARGLEPSVMARAIREFKPLAHRIELCGAIGDVRFYDDSKATNAHAALAGINSLPGDLVTIVGGVDKGLDLSEFARVLTDRARHVVLIGELRDRMHAALRDADMPDDRIHHADTMDEAVHAAFDHAKPDAAIILSPACSSFDMFKSYAHRGDVFQECVRALGAK